MHFFLLPPCAILRSYREEVYIFDLIPYLVYRRYRDALSALLVVVLELVVAIFELVMAILELRMSNGMLREEQHRQIEV